MYVVKHARRNNGNQQFNKKPEGICLFSFEMKNWLTKQAFSLGLGSKTNQWQQSLRIESLNKSFLNRLDLCVDWTKVKQDWIYIRQRKIHFQSHCLL